MTPPLIYRSVNSTCLYKANQNEPNFRETEEFRNRILFEIEKSPQAKVIFVRCMSLIVQNYKYHKEDEFDWNLINLLKNIGICDADISIILELRKDKGFYLGYYYSKSFDDLMSDLKCPMDYKNIYFSYFSSHNILDFSYCDLNSANLKNIELSKFNIQGCSLSFANLTGANLRACNLEKMDLSDVCLAEANAEKCSLKWANLKNANLSEANLSFADLENANLKNAQLSTVSLKGAKLDFADFTNANLTDANLISASLKNSTFKNTLLRGTIFIAANLEGCNFEGVDLSAACLKSNCLTNTNFKNANLSGLELKDFNFSSAEINGCNFSRSNISGSIFKKNKILKEEKILKDDDILSRKLIDLNFTQAQLCDVDFSEGYLENIDFSYSQLNNIAFYSVINFEDRNELDSDERSDIENTILECVNFNSAVLNNVNFTNVNALKKITFEGVQLRNVDFSSCNFEGVDFTNANFENVNFTNANLSSCVFINTNMKNVNFTNANLSGANFEASKMVRVNLNNVKILNGTNFSYVNFINVFFKVRNFNQILECIPQDPQNSDAAITKRNDIIKGKNTKVENEKVEFFTTEDKFNLLLYTINSINDNYVNFKVGALEEILLHLISLSGTEEYKRNIIPLYFPFANEIFYRNKLYSMSFVLANFILEYIITPKIEKYNTSKLEIIDYNFSEKKFFQINIASLIQNIQLIVLNSQHSFQAFFLSNTGFINQLIYHLKISPKFSHLANDLEHLYLSYLPQNLIHKLTRDNIFEYANDEIIDINGVTKKDTTWLKDNFLLISTDSQACLVVDYLYFQRFLLEQSNDRDINNIIYYEFENHNYRSLLSREYILRTIFTNINLFRSSVENYFNYTKQWSLFERILTDTRLRIIFINTLDRASSSIKLVEGEDQMALSKCIEPLYENNFSDNIADAIITDSFARDVFNIFRNENQNLNIIDQASIFVVLAAMFTRLNSIDFFGEELDTPRALRYLAVALLNKCIEVNSPLMSTNRVIYWKNQLLANECSQLIFRDMKRRFLINTPFFTTIFPSSWR